MDAGVVHCVELVVEVQMSEVQSSGMLVNPR